MEDNSTRHYKYTYNPFAGKRLRALPPTRPAGGRPKTSASLPRQVISAAALIGKQHGPSDQPGSYANGPEPEFIEAVQQAIEGGLLRFSKRLELLQLARQLKIERFEAALLIAQVQYRNAGSGYPGATTASQAELPATATAAKPDRQRNRTELFLKIAALFLTAALADLIIVRALLTGSH